MIWSLTDSKINLKSDYKKKQMPPYLSKQKAKMEKMCVDVSVACSNNLKK